MDLNHPSRSPGDHDDEDDDEAITVRNPPPERQPPPNPLVPEPATPDANPIDPRVF